VSGWRAVIQPPKDGRWIVVLHDDGSGAELWSWYDDENGNEGWHDAEGTYDGSSDFPDDTLWIEAPDGFKGWIERRPLATGTGIG